MAVVEFTAAFAAAAFGISLPSLANLVKNELCLENTVKEGLKSLQAELESMNAFLQDVSHMPPEQRESHLNLRAGEVRELQHDIETNLHSFKVRMEATNDAFFPLGKQRFINHEIKSYIQDKRYKIKDVRKRYSVYTFNNSMQIAGEIGRMDDRESNPVGLAGAIHEVATKLSKADHVSIAGMRGVGKTTLAGAVYAKMKGEFECGAFVHIGERAEMRKIPEVISTQKILEDISKQLPIEIQAPPDKDRLRKYLEDKRCLFFLDDVRDEKTWNFVEPLFKGSAGSKIITTVPNIQIAEEIGGDVYEIKPLSLEDSKKLLHTKARPSSHDDQIVSDKILRKCGGIPLAITVIGSLLAKNPSMGWHKVYVSIGFDDKGDVFENIKKVLSSSYRYIPFEIKRCFLYLSLFPEGRWIEKNMLIWMWVADGLVDDRSFEKGESYFNELLDRSMVQWAVSPGDVGQGGCRVNTLMLALIRDLSSSENFSTVLDMKQGSTSQTTSILTRLAIHQKVDQTCTSLKVDVVRSFVASTCPGSSMPPLSSFTHMRAIDLEACNLSVHEVKHLGELGVLEYVGLVGTPVAQLPAGEGNFKALETLDVTGTGMKELPPSVEDLSKLRCLRAGKDTTMKGCG